MVFKENLCPFVPQTTRSFDSRCRLRPSAFLAALGPWVSDPSTDQEGTSHRIQPSHHHKIQPKGCFFFPKSTQRIYPSTLGSPEEGIQRIVLNSTCVQDNLKVRRYTDPRSYCRHQMLTKATLAESRLIAARIGWGPVPHQTRVNNCKKVQNKCAPSGSFDVRRKISSGTFQLSVRLTLLRTRLGWGPASRCPLEMQTWRDPKLFGAGRVCSGRDVSILPLENRMAKPMAEAESVDQHKTSKPGPAKSMKPSDAHLTPMSKVHRPSKTVLPF